MSKRKISLKDLYEEKKNQRVDPSKNLIRLIMDVTGRAEVTVRLWISGRNTPEPLVKRIIADALDVDADYLFPNKQK